MLCRTLDILFKVSGSHYRFLKRGGTSTQLVVETPGDMLKSLDSGEPASHIWPVSTVRQVV